jgi:hypothetical protein
MARTLFVPAAKTRLPLSDEGLEAGRLGIGKKLPLLPNPPIPNPQSLRNTRRRRGLCRLICDVLALPAADEDESGQQPTEDPNRPWGYPGESK